MTLKPYFDLRHASVQSWQVCAPAAWAAAIALGRATVATHDGWAAMVQQDETFNKRAITRAAIEAAGQHRVALPEEAVALN